MKKNCLFVLLSLIMIACNQDGLDFNGQVCENGMSSTYSWGPGDILPADISAYKKIATRLVESEMPMRVCFDVYQIVQNSLEMGVSEGCYIKDAMSSTPKFWQVTMPTTPRYLGDILKFSFTNPKSDSIYITQDILDRVQIYWPYSENWDGVTKPVITWLGEQYDEDSNYAYYKENGQVKSVIVDEDYAKTHPVWIINSATYSYSKLPKMYDGQDIDNNGDGTPDLIPYFEFDHGPVTIIFYKKTKLSVDGNGGHLGGTSGNYIINASDIDPNKTYTIDFTRLLVPKTYKGSMFEGDLHLHVSAITYNSTFENGYLAAPSQDILIRHSELGKESPDIKRLVEQWLPGTRDMAFMLWLPNGGASQFFSGSLHYVDDLGYYSKPFKINYSSNDLVIRSKVFYRDEMFSNGILRNIYLCGAFMWKFLVSEYKGTN